MAAARGMTLKQFITAMWITLNGSGQAGQGVTCSRMATSPGFQVWAMM